jgi:AcrR family transcriptional regulator
MRELKSVEEKILDSTLYLIGNKGTSNVPIRAIAKEAGVNVSAINYYFRSKDEMLRQTKEFFISNTIAIFSILDKTEYSQEERLILFANEIMEYTIRYSGLTVILKEADRLKQEDELSKRIVEVTKELHLKIEKLLSEVVESSPFQSKYNTIIFISSLIYPIDKSNLLNYDKAIMAEKEKRIEYIKYVIDRMKN